MNMTDVLQSRLVEYLRGSAPLAITSLDLALSAGDPLMDASALVEPTGGQGYTRETLTLGALAFVLGTGSTTKNTGSIVFGPCTNTDWPTVTHAAIVDQAGNVLVTGSLAAPRTVTVGDSFSIAVDALQILFR